MAGIVVLTTQRSRVVGTPALSSAWSKVIPDPIRKATESTVHLLAVFFADAMTIDGIQRQIGAEVGSRGGYLRFGIPGVGHLEDRAGLAVAQAVEQEFKGQRSVDNDRVTLHVHPMANPWVDPVWCPSRMSSRAFWLGVSSMVPLHSPRDQGSRAKFLVLL